MQRLKRHWESRWSRAGMRVGLGVRVVPPARWEHPGHPEEFATAVEVPLLVVHGEDDAYFPVRDAEAIAAAAPRAAPVGRAGGLRPRGGRLHRRSSPTGSGAAIEAALRDGAFPERGALAGTP